MYSFTGSVVLALAAASSVLAQTGGFDSFTKPSSSTPGATFPASDPFEITWDPSPAPLNGKISIFLLQGATNTTLQVGDAIATGLDASTGSYVWNIKSDTPVFDTYGLKLSLDSAPTTFQFSTFFHISGLSGSSNSSSSVSGSSKVVTSTSAAATDTGSKGNGTAASTSGIYSNSTKTTTTVAAKTASTTSVTSHSTSQASSTSTSKSVNAAATMGAGLMGAVAVVAGLML